MGERKGKGRGTHNARRRCYPTGFLTEEEEEEEEEEEGEHELQDWKCNVQGQQGERKGEGKG